MVDICHKRRDRAAPTGKRGARPLIALPAQPSTSIATLLSADARGHNHTDGPGSRTEALPVHPLPAHPRPGIRRQHVQHVLRVAGVGAHPLGERDMVLEHRRVVAAPRPPRLLAPGDRRHRRDGDEKEHERDRRARVVVLVQIVFGPGRFAPGRTSFLTSTDLCPRPTRPSEEPADRRRRKLLVPLWWRRSWCARWRWVSLSPERTHRLEVSACGGRPGPVGRRPAHHCSGYTTGFRGQAAWADPLTHTPVTSASLSSPRGGVCRQTAFRSWIRAQNAP
jgi:hypothetical protein